MGVVSKTIDFYQRVAGRLRNQNSYQQVGAGAQQAAVMVQNDDPFNLQNLQRLPQEFHDDLVFRRYSCTISLSPIRFVVGDPNGHTLYEKEEILDWLRRNPISSVTRLPLSQAQLIQKPAIQALINERLRHHEIQLRAAAARAVLVPANGALEAAANIEMPTM